MHKMREDADAAAAQAAECQEMLAELQDFAAHQQAEIKSAHERLQVHRVTDMSFCQHTWQLLEQLLLALPTQNL